MSPGWVERLRASRCATAPDDEKGVGSPPGHRQPDGDPHLSTRGMVLDISMEIERDNRVSDMFRVGEGRVRFI